MILAILDNEEGLTEIVTEDIELFDLDKPLPQEQIIEDIQKAVKRVAHFKASK